MGTIICATTDLGVPMKIGVKIMFHMHIEATITIAPIIRAFMAFFFVWLRLYMFPAAIVKKPVAKICIIIPIIPLCELTVKP